MAILAIASKPAESEMEKLEKMKPSLERVRGMLLDIEGAYTD